MSKKVRRLEDLGFFDNNKDYLKFDAFTSLEILIEDLRDKYDTLDINQYSAIMSLRDIIYEQNKKIKRLEEDIKYGR